MVLRRAVHSTAVFLLFILAVGFGAIGCPVFAKIPRPAGIVHQYPLSGAREVPAWTEIGIRAIGEYDPVSIQKQHFTAIGSISGLHPLTVRLSRDRTMAIFHSETPFATGEDVHFEMSAGLASGMSITDTFTFTTIVRPDLQIVPDWVRHEGSHPADVIDSASLNDTLPEMVVTVNDSATPGTIYFNNFGLAAPVPNMDCLLTCDEQGRLIRDRPLPNEYGTDFKVQPNGELTYYDVDAGAFLGLDSDWNVIDTFAALNYPTDEHELQVEPDGSYVLLGITTSIVDLSKVVSGGYDSAEVFGAVVQKFDVDGNLMFEWRGIDHYNVADSKYEDLTNYAVDFEHANSIDLDRDGNILLSNRHLCEVSNIDGVTGDFIWRFGGAHNQFKIIGDSLVFSFQHDARWLPNGHLTMFDNSNYDTVMGGNGVWIQHSRALEYEIDTTLKTARLVWQYHHTPETWSDAMGSVERLLNGNTFIGWGDDTEVSMTEVRPDNTTAFEMTMRNGNVSYRAFKNVEDVKIKDTTAGVAFSNNSSGTTLAIQAEENGTLSAIYSLGEGQFVSLTIYDMAGRAVRTALTSQFEPAGNHALPLDLPGVPGGAYECVLTSGKTALVRRFAVAM
jgi:hypothetical protein